MASNSVRLPRRDTLLLEVASTLVEGELGEGPPFHEGWSRGPNHRLSGDRQESAGPSGPRYLWLQPVSTLPGLNRASRSSPPACRAASCLIPIGAGDLGRRRPCSSEGARQRPPFHDGQPSGRLGTPCELSTAFARGWSMGSGLPDTFRTLLDGVSSSGNATVASLIGRSRGQQMAARGTGRARAGGPGTAKSASNLTAFSLGLPATTLVPYC